MIDLPHELDGIRDLYPKIYSIVSPPRCCSTALARVFWEHPEVAFYCHEPFEITYFRQAPLADVAAKLRAPLDVRPVATRPKAPGAGALVIKEMPYQVGPCFPHLAALSAPPIVFLLRNPRISIASRMDKKREVGDDPIFPLVETGWQLVREQVAHCDRQRIPYVIVRADDFRNRPLEVLPRLFERLGLEFVPEMIAWQSRGDLEIDNLGGDHTHLYTRVLSSSGLTPEIDGLPAMERFPIEGGFRQHVEEALEIYEELSGSPARITPSP